MRHRANDRPGANAHDPKSPERSVLDLCREKLPSKLKRTIGTPIGQPPHRVGAIGAQKAVQSRIGTPFATLLELLRQKDPRIEKLLSSDPKIAAVARLFLSGECNKAQPTDATQLLRAALDAIAPPNARETMASISEDNGFAWILAPPAEKSLRVARPDRPADAPSLLHPN